MSCPKCEPWQRLAELPALPEGCTLEWAATTSWFFGQRVADMGIDELRGALIDLLMIQQGDEPRFSSLVNWEDDE